jgi:leucyl aminopeptidase (aminopeptidase T)
MIKNQSFFKGIQMALKTCMGLKKGEEVLIVGDTDNLMIANSFFSVASTLGAETTLVLMKPREMHGNEPPNVVASAMLGADIIMLPTSKSLSHTKAHEAAIKNGARIASMPGINKEILEGPMKADYLKIHERSRTLVKKISKASTALITTEKGTKLELNIKGRNGQEDSGIYLDPGTGSHPHLYRWRVPAKLKKALCPNYFSKIH